MRNVAIVRAGMTPFDEYFEPGIGLDSIAAMTPADVDVAEVHDFFTGIEQISYEDLGVTERSGAYTLHDAAETTIGGGLPVNTSGGLKANGHPPGATGVAQCGARVGLAHNLGGPIAASAVTILEGPVARGR
ncbi:hypothetical protein A5662_18030 [Mycobacteriaceae bacterium 1482268.1]|nr:hypothetical protein A5662_18030 [Mycobacteriaceae bacterium 1482268.1]